MNEILVMLSFGPDGWGDQIATGVVLTVTLALASLPLGLVIGLILALAKKSSEPSLRAAADVYTTLFRGLPELLTLFLVYYGGQILIQQVLSMVGIVHFEVSAFVAGMVALSLVFSSYASEAFLSAFRGISQGQYEGAHALGLSRFQTLRLIILPQLIRLSLPALGNLWLILLKDTSLVSIIGMNDIIRYSNMAARTTKEPFLFFSLACLIYLVLAVISSFGISSLEKWTKKGDAQK
ncbi:ABC transporter permease [Pseudovibrio exalbescens]|uniref:ABC transporter permease n=1 Tax=Pseudovibrio exalbescens TaxID=197461 RepID=A0A1U7JEF3_9HYPH|nr:ABC transporter permease [Pseudovibrio exalbescens]OKL43130.1 ABC transporter permease [Pseudovibrio exalbescens]